VVVVVVLYAPDPDFAHVLQFLLEHAGFTVQTATDMQTVATLAADRPALTLVDAGETSDPWALCGQMHRLTGSPVICLVPADAPPTPEPALHAVPAPVSPRALRTLVRSLISRSTC
jgi:DNA-binding response OmpR family regulator